MLLRRMGHVGDCQLSGAAAYSRSRPQAVGRARLLCRDVADHGRSKVKPDNREFVAGTVLRRGDLDDFAGLDPASAEFKNRLMDHIGKRKELDELQELARVATRAELEQYEPIPDEWKTALTLGTFFDGDDRIFELYVPRERPADAVVLTSARVNRVTREVAVKVTNLQRR
jgi:hypothetical protein